MVMGFVDCVGWSARPASIIDPAHRLSARPTSTIDPAHRLSARPTPIIDPAHRLSARPTSTIDPAHRLSAHPTSTIDPAHRLSAQTSRALIDQKTFSLIRLHCLKKRRFFLKKVWLDQRALPKEKNCC
ncbi:hypothetical protein L6R29_00645 [Myxococcota bacterium]|nr:hypothetical protein [Myxococcota bacterium]